MKLSYFNTKGEVKIGNSRDVHIKVNMPLLKKKWSWNYFNARHSVVGVFFSTHIKFTLAS